MANSYFQFKKFTVQQEKAALKVSTDSCLFGAWVAEEIRTKKDEVRRVLDIGAGTGLLMLMLAQKCKALIDGIEIDEPSYQQAKENIEASAWKERLELFHGDVKQFQFQKKYDFIISNPPFYEGDLKSDASNRNVAMHDEGLKLDELVKVVDQNLSDDGNFAVLLPWNRAGYFIGLAREKGFYLNSQTIVSQSDDHHFFRALFHFGRQNFGLVRPKWMSIRTGTNYSTAFIKLLKDYYLYL